MNLYKEAGKENVKKPNWTRVLLMRLHAEYLLLKSTFQDAIFTDNRGSETLSQWRSLRAELKTMRGKNG